MDMFFTTISNSRDASLDLIIEELNNHQHYFRFKRAGRLSLKDENQILDLKKLANASYKYKKAQQLDFLIVITDKQVIHSDTNTVFGLYTNIKLGLGFVHWASNEDKYQLIRNILRISIQREVGQIVECRNNNCFFDSGNQPSFKYICKSCSTLIQDKNGNQYLESIRQCINKVGDLRVKEQLSSSKNLSLLDGIDDNEYVSDFSVVIMMDIVGYSLLTDTEQKKQILTLQEVIKDNEHIRQYFCDMIFLPTGDGCCLSMFGSIARKAVHFVTALQKDTKHRGLRVRFGINLGSVFKYKDINGNLNVAGSGVNLAARTMDKGDSNHIIANRTVYDYFGNLDAQHKKLFISLGKVRIKHNEYIEVFNICNPEEGIGNSEKPEKIKQAENNDQ